MATIINKFGTLVGWNKVTVSMMGRDIEGIDSVSYGDKVTKENAYGAGKYPVGREEKNYEPDMCKLSLYKEEVLGIQLALPPNGRIQDIAPFDVVVEYELPSGVIYRDRVRNCEFTNNGVDVKQSDGSIKTEFELLCSHINWNV